MPDGSSFSISITRHGRMNLSEGHSNPNTMLLLRNPISSTKKLFRKTLNSFKSLFSSPSYHKLSKTSHPTQTLNTQTSSSSYNNNNNNNKTMVLVSSSSTSRPSHVHVNNTKEKGKDQCVGMMRRDQERRGFVAQKLRELEMVDVGNIDHKLDIEEVLHYYSRLTCQPYLHIVDTLFMEIFAEFSDPKLKSIQA